VVNQSPIHIELTPDEQRELAARARSQRMAHRDVLRAKIVLLLAEGCSVSSVARQVGKTRKIIRKWGERFVKKRLEGLNDKAGRGREPVFSPGDRGVPGQARMRAA
jgi:transposase-like protein